MSQDPNQEPFVPPPPPQPSIGNPMYPPHVLEQKTKEVAEDIRTALILGLLGVVCCGFILGFLAFRRANHAIEVIDQYGVSTEKRGMATGLKVLGIVDIIGSALVLLGRFYWFQ